MVDATKVVVGVPDQQVSGAVFDAPVGTDAPTSAIDTLDSAFEASGYVSSDGLSIAPDTSTNSVTDWGGATVKEWLSEFACELTWKEIEMSYKSACHAFGESAVSKTPATTDHGEQLKIAIGARLPEPRAWCFKIKDGKSRVLVYVPNGQVTAVDEIAFSADDAVGFGITLKTYPDQNGNNIYIFTDDGVVTK